MAKGEIFVVSAPSGTGKTTLIRRLLAGTEKVHFSVSHTTRAPRPGEVEGADYHFVSDARFEEMAARGEFLEWAEIYSRRYGTSLAEVDGALSRGDDVLLDVDTQGAASVKRLRPEAVLIFILPPGAQALRDRIAARAQDDPDQVRRRLEATAREIAALDMYEYCVVNDSVERALNDLHAIFRARRLRRERAPEQVLEIVRGFEISRAAPAP